MRKRSIYSKDIQNSWDIFRAFTDIMANAFIVLFFFCIIAFVTIIKERQEVKSATELQKQLEIVLLLNQKLQETNERLKTATPIIIDERSGKFRFTSGSAELNPDLKNYLKTQIIPSIKTTIQQKEIDFIQVIGHTDGQGISQAGNLDKNIERVARGKQKVTQLVPGSNTDLGLMRALAVVRQIQQTSGLENVEFRAYSAGQLYLPDGQLAEVNRDADATRRRIEIRFIPPGERQL